MRKLCAIIFTLLMSQVSHASVTMNYLARYMWQGLSSDTKPTDSRVNVNDIFLETDTGKFFIWNGSTWSQSTVTPPMQNLP